MKADKKSRLVPKLRFPEFNNEPDWKLTQLSTAAQFVNDRVPVSAITKAEYVSTENILPDFAGIAPPSSFPAAGSVTIFRTNDVLVSNIRPYLKKVWRATRSGGTSNDVLVLRGKPCISDNYLAAILKSDAFIDYVMAGAKGLKMPRGDIGLIKKYPVRLPQLPEQQKIADCLSSLDDLIAAERRKLDALRRHKEGLMQQLFPQEGETVPRLRFPEFRDAGKWEENTLIELAQFRRGSFPQPYGLPEWYDQENGMPFVQVFDVNDNFRLKTKTKSKISELAAEQSVFIPKGTLLVTLQGSIGRVAITQYNAYVDRTLLLFESFRKPIEKVFFAYVIHNLFDIEKRKAPGGIIKTITKEVLSSFVVKFPSLSEQRQIAACLSSLEEILAAQLRKVECLTAHKQGLLQQLFPSPEGNEG